MFIKTVFILSLAANRSLRIGLLEQERRTREVPGSLVQCVIYLFSIFKTTYVYVMYTEQKFPSTSRRVSFLSASHLTSSYNSLLQLSHLSRVPCTESPLGLPAPSSPSSCPPLLLWLSVALRSDSVIHGGIIFPLSVHPIIVSLTSPQRLWRILISSRQV